jgi:hypothetical protein
MDVLMLLNVLVQDEPIVAPLLIMEPYELQLSIDTLANDHNQIHFIKNSWTSILNKIPLQQHSV